MAIFVGWWLLIWVVVVVVVDDGSFCWLFVLLVVVVFELEPQLSPFEIYLCCAFCFAL